jgi:small subunit ribosomal protein S1
MDGVDGLVHISDISWTEHVAHPTDKYKKGDIVDAIILSTDPENRKISLGIKQLEKDPWINVASTYQIGSIVEGVVSKVTNFGAFIKLPTGIEGLVHISEISDKEISKIEEILKVGQTEKFKVIKVSAEDRKLGLSLRALKEPTKTESEQAKAQEQQQDKTIKIKQEQKSSDTIKQAQPTQSDIKKQAQTQKPKEVQQAKSSLQQALEEHAAKIKKQLDEEKKS